MVDEEDPCPCGSTSAFGGCCRPVLDGSRPALSAEALMRSRYTAFVVGDEAHLLRSWHPTTRPDAVRFVVGQRWTALEILAIDAGRQLDRQGTVEFRASYERRGRPGELREVSRFVRGGDGSWLYLAGEAGE